MCRILTHFPGYFAAGRTVNVDFDTPVDRSGTSSAKWIRYPEKVLPFWVADMDFRSPDFILDAIRSRVDHGILGYTRPPASLVDAFQNWLQRNYGWDVDESWLVWIPGVVPGINLAANAALSQNGTVLIPTPVYYPFLDVPANSGGQRLDSPLIRDGDRWVMDYDDLENKAADADVLLLANPQNPTGRAYTQQELQQLTDICARHDVVLVSDEIHSAIILEPDCTHCVTAPLNEQTKTISLFAPTKTYNIPGLSCAVAVIPDRQLRRRFNAARRGLVGSPGPLDFTASEAAFNDQTDWLPQLLDYLRGNRDRLAEVVGDRMTRVEATYLGWIDVSDLEVADIESHFLQHGLGLSIGSQFAGEGFVRFNFACPRPVLEEGLKRLGAALSAG